MKWFKEIYLQCEAEHGLDEKCSYPKCQCEVSWCQDRINDSDVRYVLAGDPEWKPPIDDD